MVQMLRVMLSKEMARGGMTEDEYKEVITRMQDSVGDIVTQCQREKEEEEEVRFIILCTIYSDCDPHKMRD